MGVLETWRERDRTLAVSDADLRLIDTLDTVRTALVAAAKERRSEWGSLAFRYGLLLGEGGSPTLAAQTLDNLRSVLSEEESPFWRQGRVLVVEGYCKRQDERSVEVDTERWKYPSCTVPVGPAFRAVFVPRHFEPEPFRLWCEEVAASLAKDGVRTVRVTPPIPPILAECLQLVGISPAPREKPFWRRMFW